jgi:hypothetical protein
LVLFQAEQVAISGPCIDADEDGLRCLVDLVVQARLDGRQVLAEALGQLAARKSALSAERLADVEGTQLTIKTEKGEDAGASYFDRPVREVFAKEIVAVFAKEKAVAEIARKHPKPADQVAPLKAWLQGRLKDK